MQRITQSSVRKALTERLNLESPEYRLESYGGRIGGSIISATFKGKRDHKRQDMISDALDEAFGPESRKRIGMLLAYTPDEWNIDEILVPTAKPKRKKAG